MRIQDARKQCPGIIQRPARPEAYAKVSTRIMRALDDISPDMEVFSVDEAFLDLTHCQKLHGTPARMGRMTKEVVYAASGLLCSVGISGDKTTAKFAAKLQKPNGLTIIPPWEARERLADQPTTALCGIADGIGGFLAQHGAYTCGDVGKLPISVLARRFGNLGRRIWLMCQGEDPDQIHMDVPPPKSLGHGKVMPPGTRDKQLILTYLQHMSEKVGKRLRQYKLETKYYFIGLKTDHDWISDKLQLATADNNGRLIYRLCRFLVENHWHGEPIRQVQVTALNPLPQKQQLDLFASEDETDAEVNAVMDEVNERFGEFTLAPARLLNRSSMPNVIAPAWRPNGLRQTI